MKTIYKTISLIDGAFIFICLNTSKTRKTTLATCVVHSISLRSFCPTARPHSPAVSFRVLFVFIYFFSRSNTLFFLFVCVEAIFQSKLPHPSLLVESLPLCQWIIFGSFCVSTSHQAPIVWSWLCVCAERSTKVCKFADNDLEMLLLQRNWIRWECVKSFIWALPTENKPFFGVALYFPISIVFLFFSSSNWWTEHERAIELFERDDSIGIATFQSKPEIQKETILQHQNLHNVTRFSTPHLNSACDFNAIRSILMVMGLIITNIRKETITMKKVEACCLTFDRTPVRFVLTCWNVGFVGNFNGFQMWWGSQ